MPVDIKALEETIRSAFPITHLEIEDRSSGCGENFSVLIVSSVSHATGWPGFAKSYLNDLRRVQIFEGKTTLAKHRLSGSLSHNPKLILVFALLISYCSKWVVEGPDRPNACVFTGKYDHSSPDRQLQLICHRGHSHLLNMKPLKRKGKSRSYDAHWDRSVWLLASYCSCPFQRKRLLYPCCPIFLCFELVSCNRLWTKYFLWFLSLVKQRLKHN